MRIWAAVILFVLVVLVVANDVSAKKSEREKTGRNEANLAAEETSHREKNPSTDYRKKSKSVKSHDKSRDRKRRSVDDVDSDVTRGKEDARTEAESAEEDYGKKSRSPDLKNKKHRANEAPLKSKKVAKEGKKVEPTKLQSSRKTGEQKSVKKRSTDESVGSDVTDENARLKVSPSKSSSKYSKSEKHPKKRENLYSEENNVEKAEKRVRQEKVQSKTERSKDKRVTSDKAKCQGSYKMKSRTENYQQCGTGGKRVHESASAKLKNKHTTVKYVKPIESLTVEDEENFDGETSEDDVEEVDEERKEEEEEETEEQEEAFDEEVEENQEGNESSSGLCPSNESDECNLD